MLESNWFSTLFHGSKDEENSRKLGNQLTDDVWVRCALPCL